MYETDPGESYHVFSARTTCSAFSCNGKYLASSALGKYYIRIWDPVSGKLRHTLACHLRIVSEAILSNESQQLAAGFYDGVVQLWDPLRGILQHILKYDMPRGISDDKQDYWKHESQIIVYANDGKELASGYGDGAVRLWNTENGNLVQTLEVHPTGVMMLAYSLNDQLLASFFANRTPIIWDRKIGRRIHELETGYQGGSELAFSPDGQYVAARSKESDMTKAMVSIWDLMKGDLWKTLESHLLGIYAIAFAPDSQYLAVSDGFGASEIWYLATGKLLRTIDIGRKATNPSFSDDGKYLKTDYGEFEIGSHPENAYQSSPSSNSRWSILGDWLRHGSREMLWIPADFRPKRSAYRDGIIALGRESGEITFLEVDPNYRPPE